MWGASTFEVNFEPRLVEGFHTKRVERVCVFLFFVFVFVFVLCFVLFCLVFCFVGSQKVRFVFFFVWKSWIII